MDSVDMFNAATAPLTFHDFLDRMRHPQAADLVRSIKRLVNQSPLLPTSSIFQYLSLGRFRYRTCIKRIRKS